MKSTVVDESLSSYKPMYCSREYQASTRLIQQYEKSTLNNKVDFVFISISGAFTQTLLWYSITNYILLSFSYHIYLYVFIYIHIAFTYQSIFFHMSRWIFWHTYILCEIFSKFCLPDVVSAVTVLFSMMSFVVSICVIVGDDDEPNKVEFVLIDICDKRSETLHWYYIT